MVISLSDTSTAGENSKRSVLPSCATGENGKPLSTCWLAALLGCASSFTTSQTPRPVRQVRFIYINPKLEHLKLLKANTKSPSHVAHAANLIATVTRYLCVRLRALES